MSAPRSFKAFFRRFHEAAEGRVHFAAHSHHYWPDVTFDAHVQAWNDAARYADRKWDHVFGTLWPKAQAHVARVLSLPDPGSIAFAPNTHELVLRVMSAIDAERPRILTTDSEFHSFSRQTRRLEEAGEVDVVRIATEPFATFPERFAAQANAGGFDLVLFSQVMFNSGWAVPDLDALVAHVHPEAFVVVDGYHGFLALPTSLRALAERVFYVGGGYKYAMSGEGACFLHAPSGYGPRPRNTGWFASFGALASSGGGVDYGPGGGRFLGATFDPTAIHRFVAVMDWLAREAISVDEIHAHVLRLQELFLAEVKAAGLPLEENGLVVPMTEPRRGHFLTFRRPDASSIYEKLLAAEIVTDVRGDRLRFGFGLYHDAEDVVAGVRRMQEVLA